MNFLAVVALALTTLCATAHADPIRTPLAGPSMPGANEGAAGDVGIGVPHAPTSRRVATLRIGTEAAPDALAPMLRGPGLGCTKS